MNKQLQWWIDLQEKSRQNIPCVLVTVLRADGSTPREAGATMLVWHDASGAVKQSDTIGGGHLEWQALDMAQQLLQTNTNSATQVQRFNLSARLGQCCGGVMWLLFEKQQAQNLSSVFTAWQNGHAIQRSISMQHSSSWQISRESFSSPVQWQQDAHSWSLQHIVAPYLFKVLLFGAGHVGEAIVRNLLSIGVHIQWVDVRDDIFPQDLHTLVHCISTDSPEAELDHFSADGAVLILTHDHQLDLQLCYAALHKKQKKYRYVGMIGSKSKRAIFEKRMRERAYTEQQLAQLVCPIGIAGINSKQPACIAIAVVAELLQRFN